MDLYVGTTSDGIIEAKTGIKDFVAELPNLRKPLTLIKRDLT
jgi:hypothetical protein